MGEQNTRKPRHYIIVVPGIGEQTLNQTATEVVHRFAEVRWKDLHPNAAPPLFRNLIPADLSGQSVRRRGAGHGWSEFNGIPVDFNDNTGEFDGKPATSGRNFRFVDLHWKHILHWHGMEYASPAEWWIPALLARINTHAPEEWTPEWATRWVRALVDNTLPLRKLLSKYYPGISRLVFEDFLSDLHLYGYHARTRGKAVRHFHVILDEIHLRDFINWHLYGKRGGDHYEPPVYTIFAHSLGSIMSFDALVYAYAREDIREGRESAHHICPSVPFPGYTEEVEGEKETWERLMYQLKTQLNKGKPGDSEEMRSLIEETDGKFSAIPPLLWRNQVRNFITLGSPIDKYHVIWFQNYLHMGLRTKDGRTPHEFQWWKEGEGPDAWLDEPRQKIIHYNLCDEQDPIGHHLDVAQASENYARIFNTRIPVAYRDVVFRRYAAPGFAHLKYWGDRDLFKGIVKEVIDGEKVLEGPDPDLTEYEKQNGLSGIYFLRRKFWNRRGAYEKTLHWMYLDFPLLISLVTGSLLSYGFYGLLSGGLAEWNFGLTSLIAILTALFLWTMPLPTGAYAFVVGALSERFGFSWASPEVQLLGERGEGSLWERWKPRRSVFADLVAGAVEWRHVLILMSEGGSPDRETCLKNEWRMAFPKVAAFWERTSIRFAITSVILAISAILLTYGKAKTFHRILESIVILSATYLATMFYVVYVFINAKRKGENE